jgi:Tol biopolymer transport system component
MKRVNARVMTQLTNDAADDAMPTFSPDGSKIAFASNRSGNWDIYVMPVGGGKAVQLTQDGADELHPSWSPTGNELVYSRLNAGNGRWEMWTIDASSPQTTSFIGYGLFPQWCPTAGTGESGSDRIVFQLARERGSRSYGIWTIEFRDGVAGNPTEIASDSRAAFINPTWSEDGQWIVFAQADAHSGTDRPKTSDLWMVSAEGTGLMRLTTDEAVACQPTFGGGRLYYVSDRTGADNVWSLDVSSAIASAGAAGATLSQAENEEAATGE